MQRALGPSGGCFIKNKIVGKVPLLLGYNVEGAEINDGHVLLHLRSHDGSAKNVNVEHMIAATGYVVECSAAEISQSGNSFAC